MLKPLSLLFILFSFSFTSLAEKHALIIAIGDYPVEFQGYRPRASWADLSSKNDVKLIQHMLLQQKFEQGNIRIITDAEATKQGIVSEIEALIKRVRVGDVVVLHYSGHGQQIWEPDDGADENDGYDEALVPYGAFPLYDEAGYHGEYHLRDDEFGSLLNDLRNKLTNKGQLLVILDCCHSATASRGETGDEIVRGGVGPLEPENYKPKGLTKELGSDMLEGYRKAKENAAPMIMIAGSRASEQNFEFRGYGSLSYALSAAMERLGSGVTYRQLFSNIEAQMAIIAPKQHPTLEGEPDLLLFKNEYVKQQPYFKVKSLDGDVLTLEGGQLNGIFEGTTFNILKEGTREVNEKSILANGTVTKSNLEETVVKVNTILAGKAKDFWAFVDKTTFGDISVNVQFDASVIDASVMNGIKNYLTENKLGTIVKNAKDADIIVAQKNNAFLLKEPKQFATIGNPFEQASIAEIIENINNALFDFAQGKFLSKLNFNDRNYEFEIALIPVDYNHSTKEIKNIYKDYKPTAGTTRIRPGKDDAILRIINKGSKGLYFSIIEINSKGEVSASMPSASCMLSDEERYVPEGDTIYFTNCVYSYSPPYEKLILKAFGTPTAIDLKNTVSSRGETNAHENVIEQFFQQSYSKSRGGTASAPVSPDKAFTTQIVYEIVQDE